MAKATWEWEFCANLSRNRRARYAREEKKRSQNFLRIQNLEVNFMSTLNLDIAASDRASCHLIHTQKGFWAGHRQHTQFDHNLLAQFIAFTRFLYENLQWMSCENLKRHFADKKVHFCTFTSDKKTFLHLNSSLFTKIIRVSSVSLENCVERFYFASTNIVYIFLSASNLKLCVGLGICRIENEKFQLSTKWFHSLKVDLDSKCFFFGVAWFEI